MYADAVIVQYYDAHDPAVRAAHADLIEAIEAAQQPLPVALLRGNIIAAGSVDPLRIVPRVVQSIQGRATAPQSPPPAD